MPSHTSGGPPDIEPCNPGPIFSGNGHSKGEIAPSGNPAASSGFANHHDVELGREFLIAEVAASAPEATTESRP